MNAKSTKSGWAPPVQHQEEREIIIDEIVQALKHLDYHLLMKCRRIYDDLNYQHETQADDLEIMQPRPPNHLIGSHLRERIEKNTAEWILYLIDMKILIEEKRAKGKQLLLPFKKLARPFAKI